MAQEKDGKRLQEAFATKQFEVEHALNMFAHSFVTIPAFGIYEDDLLKPLAEQIRKCHIYLIGIVPKTDFVAASREGDQLAMTLKILGQQHVISLPIPDEWSVGFDPDDGPFLEDKEGNKYAPDHGALSALLRRKLGKPKFKVLYIGQAFGEDGSRSALDRLKKHETLQKIAIQGVPEGYGLTLIMLEIMPTNRVIMMFNPWAIEKDDDDHRLKNGLDKLFDTNEAERTTLYEASLIRYFQPRFNKEFKNSFPSTSMKLLADCYEKDINSVVAEICHDDIPFTLFSDAVAPRDYHIASHDLHSSAARKVFFARDHE